MTIQPILEEVRTFRGSQHTYSKLHSSRLSNARATTTQPKHSTELALCPRCHLAWASEGTLVGPGMDTHGTPVPTQWEGRGWHDCTHEHMAQTRMSPIQTHEGTNTDSKIRAHGRRTVLWPHSR